MFWVSLTLEAEGHRSLAAEACQGSREALQEETVHHVQSQACQAASVASLQAYLEVACHRASASLPSTQVASLRLNGKKIISNERPHFP